MKQETTQDFIKRGGKIKKIKQGVTGDKYGHPLKIYRPGYFKSRKNHGHSNS